MKSYSKKTIKRFNLTIEGDEFNDAEQNKSLYDDHVSGYDELTKLLDINDTTYVYRKVLNVGAGSGSPLKFPHPVDMYYLEPNPDRVEEIDVDRDDNIIPGWCENIDTELKFDMIICWGTLCFVRSIPETLIQFNDRLFKEGMLVLDVVKSTSFPLCQTADPDSFIRNVSLYGFELQHRIPFDHLGHNREGIRFKKVRDFDPRYLRMPQAKDGLRNFIPERDWFLS
jgi:hypothetical protein